MDDEPSSIDNRKLDEGLDKESESPIVMPMATVEMATGKKPDQANDDTGDSSAKPYIHVVEDHVLGKQSAHVTAEEELSVPGNDEGKKLQRNHLMPKKRRPSMAKALSKLGHNEETGKVCTESMSRRGSLHDAVLGAISKRRAQFRKENRALSFRPKQPGSKAKPWKLVPLGIISYQDPRRISWDILIFLLLIYIALVTPIRIGFDQEANQIDEPFFYYLEKAIDVIFILDIAINFCTSYADDKNKEIVDRRAIAINYIQTWFFLDFISSIPLDWIMESQGGSDGLGNIQAAKTARVAKAGRASKIMKITRVLKLTKLLRLARGGKMWTKYMDYFQFSRIQVKLGSLLLMTLLISHIFACIFALIAKLNSLVDPRNDEYSYSWLAQAGLTDEPWFVQYAAAMYFCVATITTVGYGDIVPQTTLEQLFVTLVMLFGGAFYGFIIASLAALLSSWDINKTKFDEKMDSISNYMKVRKFPAFLSRKIKAYYRHYYNKRTALDERAILSELSTQLRREVVDFMVSDVKGQILKEVPMFKGIDMIHLATLLAVLKPLTATAGEYIVKEGQATEEMFILMSGTLHARINESDEVLAELKAGACFGELAALGLKPVCSTSMIAVTFCELYSLSRVAIYDAFQGNFSIIDEMVEKAVDATIDSSIKDKKHRRESEKIMREWSTTVGKSLAQVKPMKGRQRGNKDHTKSRVRSSPYFRQRRESLGEALDTEAIAELREKLEGPGTAEP